MDAPRLTSPNCLSGSLPPDGRYHAIATQSRLDFKAKAFGITWVTGHLPSITGVIDLRAGRLSGTGEVSAERIDTGLRPRDWHLRTRHYLHASRHPMITLAIRDAAIAAGSAECEVTVRGTTAPTQLDLDELELSDGVLRLRAHGTVDRTRYPMWPPIAGVSRLVHVELTVAATRAGQPR